MWKKGYEPNYQRRQWHPTPVLLPGKSYGWRSLLGCSPWGCWESDMTERLDFHFLLSCIGEGNGNPLECSCLENPRDGRAWWAAVYGVAQSRTRLKRLAAIAATVFMSKFQKSCRNGNQGLKELWQLRKDMKSQYLCKYRIGWVTWASPAFYQRKSTSYSLGSNSKNGRLF